MSPQEPEIRTRRRADDDPKEHWLRLKWSLVLGTAIFAAGIGLRIAQLVGEPTLVAFVFLAGVVIKGESVIGLVRASKRGNGAPPAVTP